MDQFLTNPVFNALLTGDRHLAHGTASVKYFDEEVSPFVGVQQNDQKGFDELYALLPPGRKILYAAPQLIDQPQGWKILQQVPGIQMVLADYLPNDDKEITPLPLGREHIDQMVALATLTKPGPFGQRTIEFGHYHGLFDGSKLIAMTGQRLHPGPFTEISAVCTHPDYLGKGYAAVLVQHQTDLIRQQKQKAFLHVRKDNERAIALYRRLGFMYSRDMIFYFMQRHGLI